MFSQPHSTSLIIDLEDTRLDTLAQKLKEPFASEYHCRRRTTL